MSIDWFTFTAQILNFLLLVWLLKRFLYGPITRAMQEREQRIAARLTDAAAAREAADREAALFREKLDELQHTRAHLLAQAGREVEQWKQEHIRRAEEEVEKLRADWMQTLHREQRALLRELQQRVAKQVQQLARRVLQELADEQLERRAVSIFLERLRKLDGTQRSEIATAVRNGRHHVFVETAFDLSAETRAEVTQAVQQAIGEDLSLEFRVRPELICGIELQAAGYKVAWTAAESLESLAEEFATALDSVAVVPEKPAAASHPPAAVGPAS